MAKIVLPSSPKADLSPDEFDIPSSVLFMCSFNAVRSPMAVALTRHYCGHQVYVESIGIKIEDETANPFAIAVMEEIGLDITNHHLKTMEDLMDSSFDIVVTLSPEAQHRAIDMTRTLDCQVEYWPTLDPTAVQGNRETILSSFRQTRDMLDKKIKSRFKVDYFPTV